MRSKFNRKIAYTIASLLLLSLLFLGLRNPLANKVLDSKLEDLAVKTGITVQYDKLHISGFDVVNMAGISASADSLELLNIQHLSVNIRLWSLIQGRIALEWLEMQNGKLNAGNVWKWRSKQPTEAPKDTLPDTTAGPDIPELLKRVRYLLPPDMLLKSLEATYIDSTGSYTASIEEISISNRQIRGLLALADPKTAQQWAVTGSMEKGLSLKLQPTIAGPLPIAFAALGASLMLDSAEGSISFDHEESDGIALNINLQASQFQVKHISLSSDTLGISFLQAGIQLRVSLDFIEVDSGSTFAFNAVKGQFAFKYPLRKKLPLYKLQVIVPWMEANDFFASLPRGAFDDTRNLKAKGKLKYSLYFDMDGRNPDALAFESSMERKDFRILDYPGTPLTLMNGNFSYQAYSGSTPMRSFTVGPENPFFTPFISMPQNLVNCVLTTEDPSFFRHGGFVQEAFRESIATNYREKKFKRGGSTISMQLVKNVFLNRKKTVFRKMEEALIVWLIESQRLSSKERMMEVYLNVIEWGPNIYGIGEASQFYFSKKPHELKLSECLFLANIIPRPTSFRYCFDKEAYLRDFMIEKSRFIANRMVFREFLTATDTIGFTPDVELKGPARDMIIPLEVVPVDSLEME